MLVALHILVLFLSVSFSVATSEIISDSQSDINVIIPELETLGTEYAAEQRWTENELISQVQAGLEASEKRIHAMEESLSKQSGEMALLKDQLEGFTPAQSLVPRTVKSSVSFYAYTHDTRRHLHRIPIVFDDVVTNVGDCYNSYIGTFTCSVPGSYFFAWDVYVGGGVGHDVNTELIKNGNPMSFATAGTTDHLAMSGSSSAVLELAHGDSVWVRISEYTNAATVLYPKITKFSGFLI